MIVDAKKEKEKESLLFKLLLITVFFNIWFPKAGIKVSGIPFTIGNVFFAITFIIWILKKIRGNKVKISNITLLIIIGIFYFIIKYIMITIKGFSLSSSVGYIIPLTIYPIIYFIVYDVVDSEYKLNKIIKIIIYGFFFLCIYSIIQYIVGIQNCDIPGLTVNLTDYIENGEYWFLEKANGVNIEEVKIVSTYQNGNLFGIGMILIYPIVYNYYKQKKNNKILNLSLLLFILCVFLSLSRACWLGIILFILFGIFFENEKSKESLAKKIFIFFAALISITLVFQFIPSIASRFLNTDIEDWISMSGRTEGMIEVFQSVYQSGSILAYMIGPFGITNYSGLAYEMFPISLFVQVGLIGMFLLYGLFFKVIKTLRKDNYLEKAVRLSIAIWLLVGIIECGYWLPPTALNIFLIIGLGYSSQRIYKEREKKQ